MLTLKERQDISELYKQIRVSQINEMGLGPVALGDQPVGKPVEMELELPADETEEDNEIESDDRSDIEMACTALFMSSQFAGELLQIIKQEENLPAWMSYKITLAFDYLSEVYNRIKYKDECECISQPEPETVEVHTVGMYNVGAAQSSNLPL